MTTAEFMDTHEQSEGKIPLSVLLHTTTTILQQCPVSVVINVLQDDLAEEEVPICVAEDRAR